MKAGVFFIFSILIFGLVLGNSSVDPRRYPRGYHRPEVERVQVYESKHELCLLSYKDEVCMYDTLDFADELSYSISWSSSRQHLNHVKVHLELELEQKCDTSSSNGVDFFQHDGVYTCLQHLEVEARVGIRLKSSTSEYTEIAGRSFIISSDSYNLAREEVEEEESADDRGLFPGTIVAYDDFDSKKHSWDLSLPIVRDRDYETRVWFKFYPLGTIDDNDGVDLNTMRYEANIKWNCKTTLFDGFQLSVVDLHESESEYGMDVFLDEVDDGK